MKTLLKALNYSWVTICAIFLINEARAQSINQDMTNFWHEVKICANDYQFFKDETFLNWCILNLNIF